MKNPTYRSWTAMLRRCYNPNWHAYEHYGGRGIEVCERWRHSYPNFLTDMGERPQGLTLDRRDTNGNYEASNCKWATASEQALSRRPKTHCKRDHEFTPENTFLWNSKRHCRACMQLRIKAVG